jgi:putative ABC transport system permease protein
MLFDLDNWQEIFNSLAKNPLRTALTAFGVFWGIFMLIVMLGAGAGLQNGISSEFEGGATNSFFLWARSTSKPYQGLPPGREIRMTQEDYVYLKQAIPEADVVAPRNQLGGWRGGNNVLRKNKTAAFNVMGDYPQIQRVENLLIAEGRFLNDFDLSETRKVAVIGSRVKELLFEANENPIGEYIQINGVYFKVVGVFASKQSGDRGDRATQTIYIPFTTFARAFNYGNSVDWFAITSKPSIKASVVEEKVVSVLQTRHQVAPDDTRAFGHFNVEKEYQKMQGLFLAIRVIVWIVGIGTLAAGVIGVSNIMLVVVKERTKEIGIRRALGAKPSLVMGQIILEAVFLTLAAGYFGLVAGVFSLEAVGGLTAGAGDGGNAPFKDPSVSLNVALYALTILVCAGALAGWMPAQRALSIAPVDALREE